MLRGLIHRHPLLRSVVVESWFLITGLEVHPRLGGAVEEVGIGRAGCP